MNLNIAYIIKLLNSLLVIILLALLYSYIMSLESKGCECAMTPNVGFIKGFTLFAIIYLLLTAFVPESTIRQTFGNNLLILYKYVDLIFILVFIYYLNTTYR